MVKNRRYENDSEAPFFGARHLQCLLIFFGISVGFAMRVNLFVAIVAMTDKAAANPNFEEYNWNEKTKSVVLSSFFWGYCMTQIPAGQLARKFGGKIMLLYGVLICSILSILTPFCADIGGWKLLCTIRVIQGLCQGVMFPSTHTILSKWITVEERGPLGTYCYSGTKFGTVVMLASSGALASSSLGWPSIFYLSGGSGLIWVLAWYNWGASSPKEYKSITAEEKYFIESSLGGNTDSEEKKPLMKIPWVKILTSVPFLVLATVHCTHTWGFLTLLTQIPTYMKNILGMDIKANALLSALPYTAMLFTSFTFSAISTYLNKRKCISVSTSRKLFNTIGHWIPMITLIALGYVNADQTNLAVILLTITVGINASANLGFIVNHIDLSPNFAGILMGISNCCANMMGVIAPLVVGLIVTNEKDPEQWRIVFFISAGFYFLGNLFFIIFGKTKIQFWNDLEQKQEPQKRNSVHVESQKLENDTISSK